MNEHHPWSYYVNTELDKPNLAKRVSPFLVTVMVALSIVFLSDNTRAENGGSAESDGKQRQFTFSWPFIHTDKIKPRGGTSKGKPVTLFKGFASQWSALQAEDLEVKERDRRAILALTGEYRVSFDFIETIGFTANYQPPAPYQSWGTETIFVLADKPNLIVLQHVLEIHFDDAEGEKSEPIVMKHWRQDWRYEDTESLNFRGATVWERKQRDPGAVKGTWSQQVFQVDDSPRYEGVGKWTHSLGSSVWESEVLWRPLPRREYSVRNDYDVLESQMRITVIPTGWIQEEDALKLALREAGNPNSKDVSVAREAGISRYERIVNLDFSAAKEYWERTSAYWEVVREQWGKALAEKRSFSVKTESEGQFLFLALFNAAESSSGITKTAIKQEVEAILEQYID